MAEVHFLSYWKSSHKHFIESGSLPSMEFNFILERKVRRRKKLFRFRVLHNVPSLKSDQKEKTEDGVSLKRAFKKHFNDI